MSFPVAMANGSTKFEVDTIFRSSMLHVAAILTKMWIYRSLPKSNRFFLVPVCIFGQHFLEIALNFVSYAAHEETHKMHT